MITEEYILIKTARDPFTYGQSITTQEISVVKPVKGKCGRDHFEKVETQPSDHDLFKKLNEAAIMQMSRVVHAYDSLRAAAQKVVAEGALK